VRQGVQLHLIGHFAHDAATTAALFDLGFGAIVRERLRDLFDVVVADAVTLPVTTSRTPSRTTLAP
jgi:hypothetical protein